MISLLSLLILNSLLCLGFYKAIQYECNQEGVIDEDSKQVFWRYSYYVLRHLPKFFRKPLGGCLTCMASVFSFVPYWMYMGMEFDSVLNWVIYVLYIFALSGMNNVMYRLIEE
jgi:hypothetical protein